MQELFPQVKNTRHKILVANPKSLDLLIFLDLGLGRAWDQSIDLAMRDSRKFETSLAIWALAPASPLARESHQTGSRLWYRLGLSSVTIPIIKQMSSFIWIVLSLFTALAEFSWVKKGLLCSIKVLSMIILDGPVSVLKQKSGNQWLTITKKPPVI